jgi:hypothetical protein
MMCYQDHGIGISIGCISATSIDPCHPNVARTNSQILTDKTGFTTSSMWSSDWQVGVAMMANAKCSRP